MRNYIYILLFFVPLFSFSQHTIDNLWILGDSGPVGSGNAPMQLNFYADTLEFSIQPRTIRLRATASTISDKQGNLLFYTNGIVIGNKQNDTLLNSQNFNPGYLSNIQSDGLNIPQNCLIIPFLADSNKYYIFHKSAEILGWGSLWYSTHLSYSVVDMSLNNGLGAVTNKNVTIINDTLEEGLLSAVKHANGRDWWIIVPVPSADFIYTLLISPTGIQGPFQSHTNGIIWGYRGFSGQTVFSPDGTKYARYDRDKYLNIFDFDRCDGTFSNLVNIYPGGDATEIGGLSFSSNSRYLYMNRDSFLYQYDLQAPNIADSKIILYDCSVNPIPYGFSLSNLAPDGKIYMLGNPQYLHVIHSPDSAGLACNLEINGISLGYKNYSSLPYHPNYSLGPLIGSKCDTLTSIIKEEGIRKEVSIYPNPATDKLYISVAGIKEPLTILLLNTLGQEVARYALAQEEQEISLANLSKGVYYCRVLGREGVYFASKVIKE